jgi:hypothetical protein
MEEGVDDQVVVVGAEPDRATPGVEGTDILRVPGHHALGLAGGAGGEHQVERVVRHDCRLGRPHLGIAHGAARGHEVFPSARAAGGLAEQHGALERRQRDTCQHFRVAVTRELADREQQSRAAALEDVRRLGALHARVERHQDRADVLRAKGRQDPFVAVGRPDRETVATTNAGGEESPGRIAGPCRQRDEIQRDISVTQRDALTVARSRPRHQPGHDLWQSRFVRHSSLPLEIALLFV